MERKVSKADEQSVHAKCSGEITCVDTLSRMAGVGTAHIATPKNIEITNVKRLNIAMISY